MKIHVWRSFSSNNSSDYRLVARFESATRASEVAKELSEILTRHAEEIDAREDFDYDTPSEVQRKAGEKHGFAWTSPLYWGDEGLSGDEPSVGVAENTLVLYHTYCGGLEDGLGDYLTARGATLEGEDSSAPTVAVMLSLPAGAAGKKLEAELSAFFDQRTSGAQLDDWEGPPWPTDRRLPYADPEEVLWFSDGETAAFYMPMDTGDLGGLQSYLKKRGAEGYRLLLCDEELTDRLRILSGARRCPECRATDLKLLVAESEKLEEDQLLCRGCGGMFTLGAVAAASPVQRVGDGRVNNVGGAGETVFLTTMSGAIYRSRAGEAFKKVKQVKGEVFGLHVVSEKIVVAAGRPGLILRSTNGGAKWSAIPGFGTDYLFAVSAAPDGTLYIAGTGAILRSTDQGASWTPTKVPVKSYVLHVDVVDEALAFAVGHKGVILRSTDGGLSWKTVASGVETPLCRIKAFDRNDAVIIGDRSVVLTSSDGGKSWTRRKVKAAGDLEDLAIGNDGRVYAVTGSGQLLISADRGKKWTTEPSGTSTHLWAMWASPSGVLWMVGDDGVVVRRDDLDAALDEQEVARAGALPTVGKSFVFTGKLKRMTRAQAKEQVALLGGVSKSSVAKDLDYLVVGDEGSPLFGQGEKGSKLLAAEKLVSGGAALQIISETVFSQLQRRDEAGGPSEKKATPKKKATARKEPVPRKKATKKATAKTAAAPKKAGKGAALPTVGRSFLFTGKLAAMTRAEAQQRVKALGGLSKSAVARDLDYLVVGDEGSPLFGQGKKGGKILAAEKLIAGGAALRIISERDFVALERRE